MKRYRESHDFYHCICNLPVNVESELALKFFEFANFGLPMTLISGLFGHLRLDSAKRTRLFKEYVPWAMRCGSSAAPLITVYWEQRWEQSVAEMKKELGIWDPPPAVWPAPLSEAAKARKKKLAAERAAREMEELQGLGARPSQVSAYFRFEGLVTSIPADWTASLRNRMAHSHRFLQILVPSPPSPPYK